MHKLGFYLVFVVLLSCASCIYDEIRACGIVCAPAGVLKFENHGCYCKQVVVTDAGR